jgi:tetratricopeptide (TPR) repeat protein
MVLYSEFRTDAVPTEMDLIESASRLEISDQAVEKWSDAWRRRQLSRAYSLDTSFYGWRDLARAFEREGNYDLAITVWERAIEKHPILTHFEKDLVQAYQTKAAHEDPIDVYEKAVEDHPTFDELYIRLHESLTSRQEYDRMIRIFEQLREDHPRQANFSRYVAEGHYELGDYNKAIEILQITISLLEGHLEPAVYQILAKCFVARGNVGDASDVLKRGLVRYGGDVDLSRDLAKIFVKDGETGRANAVLLNAFRIHPSSKGLFDDLYANNGYEQVCSTLESNLKSRDATKQEFDAFVMASKKHKNSLQYAIKILEKIRKNFDSCSENLHKTLFDLYLETGKTSKGLTVLQSATKRFSKSEWPWLLLANAYKSLGDIKSMEKTIYEMSKYSWREGENMKNLEMSYNSEGTSTTVSVFDRSRSEAHRVRDVEEGRRRKMSGI